MMRSKLVMKSVSILPALAVIFCVPAFAAQEPAAYPKDESAFVTKTKTTLEQLRGASDFSSKIAVIKVFQNDVLRTQNDAQLAFQKAPLKSKQLKTLEAKELEAIRWAVDFEQVFNLVNDAKFLKENTSREETCQQAPEDIRFAATPATGKAYELSEYRKLALDFVASLCEKSKSK